MVACSIMSGVTSGAVFQTASRMKGLDTFGLRERLNG